MLDSTVAELAATQYGVFARFQLLSLGISDKQIERFLKSGVWIRLAPGVYGYPGHRTTWDRRLWVAYLAAGERASVSHHSAAADFRVPGFPRRDLHLTVPHPDHQRVKGATVHQSRVLPAHHIIVLNGRRTTTLARTLVDLAPHVSLARLDHAYEHAIVTERLTYSKMARTFRELAAPSRKGMNKLAHVLDERGPGYVAPASELERMLHEVVGLAGLPPLVRQHPLPGHHGVEGCVDGAHPEARLIMEADGRRWHTRLANLARDLARDKQAARVGWDTLRFIFVELTDDRTESAATMRDVYDERLDLLRRK
ncbi:MAG: type IV toxin-antitoxin system AbiEi family antitoxin domain-containing protein [Acidimicrobiales bacterium]|nr:type IV toxin-antitoxin system AbiEi family antitoxin domain-containing protein [Acidimicrobiales bacterium]